MVLNLRCANSTAHASPTTPPPIMVTSVSIFTGACSSRFGLFLSEVPGETFFPLRHSVNPDRLQAGVFKHRVRRTFYRRRKLFRGYRDEWRRQARDPENL